MPVVTVNGGWREFPDGTTIRELLKALGAAPVLVVVERNGEVVYPEDWDGAVLCEGDSFEVATFVGGG